MAAKHSGPPPQPVSPQLRNALARNLREARRAAGLTQKELAALANVSREYIGQIEKAEANVSLDIVTALAAHVGKLPIELLTPPPRTRRS